MTSYIDDLIEQNEVLVQTVGKLETSANERVAYLEEKLKTTASTAKVLVV